MMALSPSAEECTVLSQNSVGILPEPTLVSPQKLKFSSPVKTGDADGGGRGGRLRNNKINQNFFQEGGTTLLFSNDNTSAIKNDFQTLTSDIVGETQRRLFSRSILEHGLKESTKNSPSRLGVQPRGGKQLRPQPLFSVALVGDTSGLVTSTPMSDSLSQHIEGSKSSVTHRSRRVAQNNVEYNPKLYSALLPATLRLEKMEEMRSKTEMGAAAAELFAGRDARQSSCGICLTDIHKSTSAPGFEFRQFESKMNELQEHGKQLRRRWKRNAPCLGSTNGGVVRVITEERDSISENGGNHNNDNNDNSGSGFQTPRVKRQQEDSEASKVAVAHLKEYVRGLEVIGADERDVVILRNELKKSHNEVELARHGINFLSPTSEFRGSRPKGKEGKWGLSWDKRINRISEDVSWMTEGSMQRNSFDAFNGSQFPQGLQLHKDSISNGVVITDHLIGVTLNNLLHHGKDTTVYVLDSRQQQGHRKSQAQQRHRTESALPVLPVTPSGQRNSLETSALQGGVLQPSMNRVLKPNRRGDVRTPRKEFSPEQGVGEQRRLQFEGLVANWRMKDIQSDLQRGEDIQRTRELLLRLRPMRVNLLDKSLGNMRESPRVILEKHRQHIFENIAHMHAEERGQACRAYVDVLESSYRGDIPEASWPAVSKALQKTRDLISISPMRCNLRAFQNILKDCFSISQLVELPVRDLLLRLSQLFDMTKTQYKTAMLNAYQRLNRPKDYHARFREIDRTLVGIPATAEIRIRITLHCCRFLQPIVPTNTYGGSGTLAFEGNADRPEVVVQIKSDNETVVSTGVWADVSNDIDVSGFYAGRLGCRSRTVYSADLLDQFFRLQICECAPLEVTMLLNGKAMTYCSFSLAECFFNTRSAAVLWIHLSGENHSESEIKLTLELLGERERQGIKKNQTKKQDSTTNIDKKRKEGGNKE